MIISLCKNPIDTDSVGYQKPKFSHEFYPFENKPRRPQFNELNNSRYQQSGFMGGARRFGTNLNNGGRPGVRRSPLRKRFNDNSRDF